MKAKGKVDLIESLYEMILSSHIHIHIYIYIHSSNEVHLFSSLGYDNPLGLL